MDVSESRPLTGLRRQARASFLADSAETASSRTGAPGAMQREDLAHRERGLPGRVLAVVLDVQPAERDVRVGDVRGHLVVTDQRLEDEHLGGGAERGHQLRGHLLGKVAEVERVLVGEGGVAQQHLAHQGGLDEPLA
jgi:hypothetical protein